MESGELRVAASLEDGRTLQEEMRAMQVTMGPSGREQFAAMARGTHDDLVVAVALECWWTGRKV